MKEQPEALWLAVRGAFRGGLTLGEVQEAEDELNRLTRERDALLEALKEVTPSMPPVDAPCHYGIVPQEKCGHCGRIAKARAAIKAVEENT